MGPGMPIGVVGIKAFGGRSRVVEAYWEGARPSGGALWRINTSGGESNMSV